MKPLLLFQNTNTNLAFCSLCLALWTHISTWFDTKYCLPLFNVIVNSGKNSDVTITVVCRGSQTASWQKWILSSVGNVKSLPFLRILLSKLQLSKGWLSNMWINTWNNLVSSSFTYGFSHLRLVCFLWFGIVSQIFSLRTIEWSSKTTLINLL